MKSLYLLLDEAETEWREELRQDYPLRSDTPVIRKVVMPGRDWNFSTDLERIFASISNDEGLQEKIKGIISKYWKGEPEEVAREILHYLLFHELYHPIEAPFSISEENNDNKKIHQAIRRGLLKANPELSPLEQVVGVQLTENEVKDFILDNRFFIDNLKGAYVQKDIIPAFDVLELTGQNPKTNFYTITRLLYGIMYGPKKTWEFFEEKAGKKAHKVAEKALSALIEREVKLPGGKTLAGKVKRIFRRGVSNPFEEEILQYAKEMRQVFSGEERYKGIERIMSILGPYIEKGMPQPRQDLQGTGFSSPQSILQDLLDDMPASEQTQFLQSLTQESNDNLTEAESQLRPSSPSENLAGSQIRNLDLLAIHEFYKINHPRVKVIGGKKIGKSVIVGKKNYWHLKKRTLLMEEQLKGVNLRRIDLLQRKTRMPWLVDLGNGTYSLNEYELKEKNLRDIAYVDAKVDVPDAAEFYVDSSGSMFNCATRDRDFQVNDSSRWDMLSHVLYGYIDGLIQGGREVGKRTLIRIHNVADKQVSSRKISAEEFWKGDIETLKALFQPDNGYSVEDLNIAKINDGRKRAYVIVTDGELVIDGRTQRESRKMSELAQNRNNHVILFEMGGTYSLGEAVRNNPKIVYQQVHDKQKMLQAGLEVLLAK